MNDFPLPASAGLACLPTPLQELKHLSERLDGPRIFVKRDDLTGLGFGGNKVRKLDFLMPTLLDRDIDTIVSGAAFQSNWCTAVSAAGRRFGIETVLVKRSPRGFEPATGEGNHLLHHLLGSRVLLAPPGEDEPLKQRIVDELKAEGRRPALLGVGGNTPHGVAGYVHAVRELMRQADDMGIRPDYLVHASGSGGTQAGTVIGARLYGRGLRVIGSSTGSRPAREGEHLVRQRIADTLDHFGVEAPMGSDDIRILDRYAGGYGFLTPGKLEAISLLAQTEGLFLDPVYSGSGMTCLIDLCRSGVLGKDQTVVFLHTGGQAGLFPYHEPLMAYCRQEPLPWTVPAWHAAHA